jgi:hypothetical protein
MKGFRFYAVMPGNRRSKSASKAHPHDPWTVARLRARADASERVECLAVNAAGGPRRGCPALEYDAAALAIDGVPSSVCGCGVSADYLRARCTRIPEALARRLHPELFAYLERT